MFVSKNNRSSAGQHFLLGMCAIVVFAVLAVRTLAIKKAEQPIVTPMVSIAVEHASPTTLRILVSRGSGRNIAEFTVAAGSGIYLSVPETWERREVRNGPLTSVVITKENSGYIRWSIPRGITVSYWLPEDRRILLHHPSPTPLLVEKTHVDLQTNKNTSQTVIVNKKPLEL